MSIPQQVVRNTRLSKAKMTDKGENSKSLSEDSSAIGALIGRALLQVADEGRKCRELDKATFAETLMVLTDKLEVLQMDQIRHSESQRATIRTPFPKYSGQAEKFDDWKQAVFHCIKSNDWTDEKRILDMLPSALSGQASRVYESLSEVHKVTLETAFSTLKQSLDPDSKVRNREFFAKAKRCPGESMRAFISRCNQYITRADELNE